MLLDKIILISFPLILLVSFFLVKKTNIKDCSKKDLTIIGACANLLFKNLMTLQLIQFFLHIFCLYLENFPPPPWIHLAA